MLLGGHDKTARKYAIAKYKLPLLAKINTDIQIILNQGGRSYYLILSENYINSIFHFRSLLINRKI